MNQPVSTVDRTYALTYDGLMAKTTVLSPSQARADMYRLLQSASKGENEYIIQSKNGAAAVLLSLEEYEAWKETAEILAIPNAYQQIQQGAQEAQQRQGTEWKLEE